MSSKINVKDQPAVNSTNELTSQNIRISFMKQFDSVIRPCLQTSPSPERDKQSIMRLYTDGFIFSYDHSNIPQRMITILLQVAPEHRKEVLRLVRERDRYCRDRGALDIMQQVLKEQPSLLAPLKNA